MIRSYVFFQVIAYPTKDRNKTKYVVLKLHLQCQLDVNWILVLIKHFRLSSPQGKRVVCNTELAVHTDTL